MHRVRPGELAEFLVHVVRPGARVVAKPDTEVLDLQRLLLGDLNDSRYELSINHVQDDRH